MKSFSFYILLMCLYLPMQAQKFNDSDSVFFQKNKAAMVDFLEKNGITQAINIEKTRIQTVPTHVILRLYTSSGDNWVGVREGYQKSRNENLERAIFDKFVFMMEVKPEQALFYVHGDDGYKVICGIDADKNNNFSIEEVKTRAAVIKTFSIPAAKHIPTKTSVDGQFDNVKNRIEKILKDYYQTKGTTFKNAIVDCRKFGDDVRADVTNLSGEIIDDCTICDFELISLVVKLSKVNDKINLEITVDGKYGSGIYNAPRREAYKEMKDDKQPYLDRYAEKMRDLIYGKLK